MIKRYSEDIVYLRAILRELNACIKKYGSVTVFDVKLLLLISDYDLNALTYVLGHCISDGEKDQITKQALDYYAMRVKHSSSKSNIEKLAPKYTDMCVGWTKKLEEEHVIKPIFKGQWIFEFTLPEPEKL
jgi:hypothetical protein